MRAPQTAARKGIVVHREAIALWTEVFFLKNDKENRETNRHRGFKERSVVLADACTRARNSFSRVRGILDLYPCSP